MKHKHKLAYMGCAEQFAQCSVSTRLKVGAVLVKNNRIISCGYNALPEHIDGPLEDIYGNTRPEVRHAEKNALMGLTRSHESADGAILFCTHSCCMYCAIDMVDAGIKEVYYQEAYREASGIQHLLDSGVKVFQFEGRKLRAVQ